MCIDVKIGQWRIRLRKLKKLDIVEVINRLLPLKNGDDIL